jgi:PadR family transcriptional regulator PadR
VTGVQRPNGLVGLRRSEIATSCSDNAAARSEAGAARGLQGRTATESALAASATQPRSTLLRVRLVTLRCRPNSPFRTLLYRVAGMGAGPRITLQTLQVLKVLLEHPSAHHYGLAIAKGAGLATGTIYPILARLEQAGWVHSDWEAADPATVGRPRRRLYQLSADGAERATHALRDAQQALAPRRHGRPRWQPRGQAPA